MLVDYRWTCLPGQAFSTEAVRLSRWLARDTPPIMATVNVLVLRAPGSNCYAEAQFAFEKAGAVAERLHVNRLREAPTLLQRYQVLVIPGGFTYGDDVAAGKILANQLTHF